MNILDGLCLSKMSQNKNLQRKAMNVFYRFWRGEYPDKRVRKLNKKFANRYERRKRRQINTKYQWRYGEND